MTFQWKKPICLLATLALLFSCCILPATAADGVQGDANSDGVFNMKDVLALRKYIAELSTDLNTAAADLNLDSRINMKDVLLMRQLLAGHAVENGTVATTTTTTPPTTGSAPSAHFTAEQQAVLALVNRERANEGLSPLALDERSCAAANVRAKEVTTLFSHTRPNGDSCFSALDEAGVDYLSAGENIAKGYPSADSVMDGWMNSPGHRANILTEGFSHLGVGYDKASASWVQLFITKSGTVFPENPNATAAMTADFLTLLNSQRAAHGHSTYTLNPTLQKAATTLAKEEGQMGEMSFTRPDGRSYDSVFDDYNLPRGRYAAQAGFQLQCQSGEAALDMWDPYGENSHWPTDDYSQIGIGYDETTGYWFILLTD